MHSKEKKKKKKLIELIFGTLAIMIGSVRSSSINETRIERIQSSLIWVYKNFVYICLNFFKLFLIIIFTKKIYI